ncbi:MAG: LysR family transcriptional regulator [Gammaproteobacteria bacterium]
MSISTAMLEALVKTAELHSVSAAADELGVSKSVISKRLAQLEQLVQATLLTRSSRRMALTPAGEIYLEYARQALLVLSQGAEGLRTLRSDPSGLIRLTAPISWGQRVLARMIPEFLQTHPLIEIELQLTDRMLDIAYEGIDIALRMTATPALDLVSIPITRLDWAICAAPAYLAKVRPPEEPAQLVDHPCMNYWSVQSDQLWQLSAGEQTQTIQIRSRYRANNPEAIADAALAGLGIALLPLYVCDKELASGRLQRVLPAWTPVTKYGYQITAGVAPDRIGFSRNQAFLSFLKQRFANG